MPNRPVSHPSNGTFVFGYVLEKKSRGVAIPGGPVILKRGRHTLTGGFGVRHIWCRHENDVRAYGCVTEAEIPQFVAAIISPGAAVHCEFERIREMRVRVFRHGVGVAVLEYKPGAAEPHYSVVTAFPSRHVNGGKVTEVGANRPAPM